MIPELGHFALVLGLAFAFLLATIPLVGVARNDQFLIRYAWPFSYGMFIFITIAIFILGYSFAIDDFSVTYVAQHSNSQLPEFFKIAAVWGGMKAHYCFGFSLSRFGLRLLPNSVKG